MNYATRFFRLLSIILIIIFFMISCKSVSKNDNKIDKNQNEEVLNIISTEAQWLQVNAVNVRSVDAEDCDFSDLLPLKEAIGTAKLVLLGEQTHGDGTTFKAKVRLIKFLHQEMDFDVLAFESGFYDCHKMWLDISNGSDGILASKRGIFSMWSYCSQVQPLFNYIADVAHGAFPLETAGVDCQFTGIYSIAYLVEDLKNFLAGKKSFFLGENDNWSAFKNTLDKLIKDDSEEPDPDQETQHKFFNSLDLLLTEVNSMAETASKTLESPAFWSQMLTNIKLQAQKEWYQGDKTEMSYVNLRDIQMADNLVWFNKNVFKDRKIIVWAATFHIIRNPQEIDLMDPDFNYQGLRTMGHALWEHLGSEIYSIGFTAYKGKFRSFSKKGVIVDIDPAPSGSLDYFMEEAGFQFGFIDLRNPAKNGEWLNDFLISRPLGNENTTANWSRILDGMFFISKMEPSTWN
jgi:erythromycin esterase